MIRKVFYGGCAGALVGLGALAPLHAAELRGVRVDADGETAQLILDLDQTVAPKVFTLEHPDRLVIDLQHTHRASALRPPLPSGVVTGVRFGSQPGGRSEAPSNTPPVGSSTSPSFRTRSNSGR